MDIQNYIAEKDGKRVIKKEGLEKVLQKHASEDKKKVSELLSLCEDVLTAGQVASLFNGIAILVSRPEKFGFNDAAFEELIEALTMPGENPTKIEQARKYIIHAAETAGRIKEIMPSPILDSLTSDLNNALKNLSENSRTKGSDNVSASNKREEEEKIRGKEVLRNYSNSLRENRKYLPTYTQEQKDYLHKCNEMARKIYEKEHVLTTALYRGIYKTMSDTYGIVIDQLKKEVREKYGIDRDVVISGIATLVLSDGPEREIFMNLLKDRASKCA